MATKPVAHKNPSPLMRVAPVAYPSRTALGSVWGVDAYPAAFWQWREANMRDAVAIHEAGHAVCMLSLGVPIIVADVSDDGISGKVQHGFSAVPDEVHVPVAVDRLCGIFAAAIYHAGLEAEKLHGGFETPAGTEWRWRNYPDHVEAERILGALFTRPPHGYAKRVAAAILSRNWQHVKTIAAHLQAHGAWRPDDTPGIDARLGEDAVIISHAVHAYGG